MNDKLPERAETLANCYAHFRQHGGSIKALAEFTKAPTTTVSKWNKNRLPLGETLLRLRYFLAMQDYSIAGFNKLHPTLLVLGKCIAFGLVSCEEVGSELGLAHVDSLYRYFKGGCGASKKKIEVMEGIVSRYRPLLASKESDFDKKYRQAQTMQIVSDPRVIDDFAAACEMVRKLGNRLLDGPIEGRVEMRKKMGQGNEPPLHLTWEVLNKLLSEPFVKLH